MTNNIRITIAFSVLALALTGCRDSGSSSTAPTPTPLPVPVRPNEPPPLPFRSDVTLSGVVFEETATGRAPIDGVDVYCEPCGAETHTWARTDSHGLYSFAGVWTDGHFPTRILFQKDGYKDPDGLPKPTPPNPAGPGWRDVVVDGDTLFDVQLVRR